MQSKYIIIGLVAVLIIGGGAFMMSKKGTSDMLYVTEKKNEYPLPAPVIPSAGVSVMPAASTSTASTVKEFTMTAYYDEKGKWFSLKEISVKKGDTVRIKITNTKGMHDFVIDELGIKSELPLDKETIVEFTADKVGDFVYYCSMKGHREGGQWGTLKVTE